MPYFWYKRGGWEIVVDAISRKDAGEYMRWKVPNAEYQGVGDPMATAHSQWSMATAMITPKRQEQVSAKIRLEYDH